MNSRPQSALIQLRAMFTSETDNIGTDRVMDWHDQIFIPTHLRHSIGMDNVDAYGESDGEHAGLLILRDQDATDLESLLEL
jgi:hypothetical protein